MKKSHKKLLLFHLTLLIIMFFNSFILNILAKYNIVIFLMLLLVSFKYLFGFEKDRNRYTKDAIYEVLIVLMLFFLIYFLFGLYVGFVRTNNYYSYYGMTTFIIPIILTIILKEYLRYNILKKSEGSKLLIIIAFITFVIIDITNIISINSISSIYKLFMFIALNLLPIICDNIACTYIAIKSGYKPNILLLIVLRLYSYLVPIVPNISDYLYSIIFIMLPLIVVYRVYLFIQKDLMYDEKIKKNNFLLSIFTFCFLGLIVFFTSGYFKYYAITIGSGSMLPYIDVGDVVIIEKNNNYEKLKVGQVLAYMRNDTIVVHRIASVMEENGKYYFYTKGDANDSIDAYAIKQESIIGTVNYKIPYIGLPAIWLRGF